jgi:polysaccharide chain length determinant protein (PEP-CTERM system associated)
MDNLNLRDALSILIRRRTAALAAMLAVFALAVAFAFLWPAKYRSTGTIQIQQPDIPKEIIESGDPGVARAVEAFADQRIQQIQQKIVATANLVDIITKLNLYADLRQRMPIVGVVQKMQRDIKLDLLSADLANPNAANRLDAGQLAAIAFTIGFDYSDPVTAQHVDNELISRFLDEDLKIRREQASTTSAFLAEQSAALEASLAEQEKRMSDFLSQHAGERNEDLSFNMQMAAQTSTTIDSLNQQLAGLAQQRAATEQQLAASQPYSISTAEGTVLVSPANQLKALQTKLATLSGQYGPNHPDVISVNRQIEALKAKIAAEGAPAGTTPATSAEADNPSYLVLQSSLKSIDSQIKTLMSQQADARKQHEVYEKRVSETPSVEREYATLSRDYENAQLRYRELKEKKMSADMNEKLEQGRKGERLVVIDSPDLPSSPHFPPRGIVVVLGFIMGTAAGFGAALLAETMSGSIRGAQQLAALVGAPPLVAVPSILTDLDHRRQRNQRIRLSVGAVVFAVLLIILYGELVTPLDVLWTVFEQRLGLS